jgi:hypothetical protein
VILLELQTEQGQNISSGSNGLPPTTARNSFNSASFLNWSTMLLFAYFGVRLVFFSLAISPFVPPDEVTHVGLCKTFSKVFLLPDNSPNSYEFGLATNIPWLYYWVMGKLLHLNFFGISDLVFLRILNIPLAFGTVWFVLRLLCLLTDDRLSRLLLLVVMTNTSMFSLLSASVSYDNLTNLLAAMATYYLFAFFKNNSGNFLATSILCQLAGCLTKMTFLPLALALTTLLLFQEWRSLRNLPVALGNYFRASGFRALWLAVPIFLTLGLNLHLYAGNYLRYGTLTPSMSQVLSAGVAMENRIAARETIFKLYTKGEISYMEALQMAGGIEHPGDKSDTFYILMNYENLKQNPKLWMGLPQYAKVWLESVMGSIFGIKAHLPMFKSQLYLIPHYIILGACVIGFLIRWRPGEEGWLPPYLVAIICFYAGYLMYKVNYNAYLYYGTPGPTLQGRYLFPIIGPFYVISCRYVVSLFGKEYIRFGLALATALLFIAYDFPWFLTHVTPEWYVWLPE